MSKLFAVSAYEQFYGGLHGINDNFVIECRNEKEAEMAAQEASLDLIQSYNIADAAGWDDEASSQGFEDDEYEEYLNECYLEDVDYEVCEITKDTNKSLEELNNEIYNLGFEDFVSEYCK